MGNLVGMTKSTPHACNLINGCKKEENDQREREREREGTLGKSFYTSTESWGIMCINTLVSMFGNLGIVPSTKDTYRPPL